ncbi:MAG: hypothetical protein ACK4J1_06450 [Hylemonella sp.]
MGTKKILLAALAAWTLAWAGPAAANPAYEEGLRQVDERNYARALQEFRRAAAQGHRDAMRAAGLMLLFGSDLYGAQIPRQEGQAVALLKAAADAGCEVSALILARMGYHQGC